MGSDVRHVRGEAQKELVKKFEVFTSKGRSRWQVWSDWITISAIAVSNATDKSHFDEREQQYMTIVKKYTKQEVDAFADMFSILVMALEDNSEQDFLGELYMCLGLGSDHAGQFFTPYHLCEFMSAVTTPAEEFQQKIGDRGWVAVCDPTCGAGALLVAFANECRKKEINYQTDVLFVAQDIDYIVGMMCYLQMSLLGMPGYVVIGDVDLTDTGFSEVELDGLLREVEDADFEEFFTEPVQQPPKAADAEQSAETQQSTQPEWGVENQVHPEVQMLLPYRKGRLHKQLHRDYHSEEVDPGLLRNRQVHS